MAAGKTMSRGWSRESHRIEADVSHLNARVANVKLNLRNLRTSMDHKFNVIDPRFQSKLDTQDEWRFLLLLALVSATVTLAATILGVLLSGPRPH